MMPHVLGGISIPAAGGRGAISGAEHLPEWIGHQRRGRLPSPFGIIEQVLEPGGVLRHEPGNPRGIDQAE